MADEAMRAGQPRVPQTDWATRATAAVESLVELVRDKSLRPALLVVKLLLIALVAAVVGLVILSFTIVGIVRLLTHDAYGGRVWQADLTVGGILCLAGGILFMLSRRTMKADTHV